MRSDNTSGITGVNWCKNTQNWHAKTSAPDKGLIHLIANKDFTICKEMRDRIMAFKDAEFAKGNKPLSADVLAERDRIKAEFRERGLVTR